MKQIASSVSFNASTKEIITTGFTELNQLLMIVNVTRNVIYYNLADNSTTLASFSSSAITTVITLGSSVSTAGHANTDKLAIFYEDKVNALSLATTLGDKGDSIASSDSANSSLLAFGKRISTHLAALRDEVGGGSNGVGGLSGTIGARTDTAPTSASDSGSLIAFLKRLNSAFDTVFSSSYLSLNNSQATFRISHPYGTLSHASPNYIISANVPQLLFSAKSTTTPRRALQIQNVSDAVMYVGFGTTGLLANPMASGAVNAVSITNGGSGYASAPTVTFSAPTGTGGRIATATGTAVISGGVVTSIVITDGGGGYLSAPSITFSGGNPSVAASASSIIGSIGWYLATTFGSIGFDRGFIPNDAIYIACATAGKAFVAFQA